MQSRCKKICVEWAVRMGSRVNHVPTNTTMVSIGQYMEGFAGFARRMGMNRIYSFPLVM